MKRVNVIALVACWAVFGLSGTAFGDDVIDFDDLKGDNIQVPDGYGGVADWGGWVYYGFDQFPYNPHSAPNRVYNNTDGVFGFGYDAFFDGAWFAGHDTVQFELYLDGDLVHTSEIVDNMSDGVVRWLPSGYDLAIDTVKVLGNLGFFVMDDVTYHKVPAPATISLLGLAGLFARRRRRR